LGPYLAAMATAALDRAKRGAAAEPPAVRVSKRSKSQAKFTFADQARSYDASSTVTMESDQERVGFYRAALAKVARGKVVMDIGTGDHGILAQLALEAGAKHVYAVEIREGAAKSARETLDRLHPGKATVFRANVAKLHRREKQLLEALQEVDIIVHEVFGTIASEEGIVQIFQSVLKSRLPQEGVMSVPQRAETLLSPVTRPQELARGVTNADESLWQGYAEDARKAQLAAPQPAEVIEFEKASVQQKSQKQRLRFTAKRAGTWDALHLQLGLSSSGELLRSEGPTTNWEDIYVTLTQPTKLKKGESVRMTVESIYAEDACEYVVQIQEPKVRRA
jgi:protein arginine N-methyltransferase 1